MVHNWNIWGFDSIQQCPPSGFEPESNTVVQKVKGVRNFVCVKGHACKIVHTRRPIDKAKRQFIAIDIFNGKVFKATFPLSGTCLVPIVTITDYELVDICEEDSYVTLLDDKGNIKADLKLPTDQDLLSQIKFEFAEGKDDIFVSVASALGKEQIIAPRRKSLLQRY